MSEKNHRKSLIENDLLFLKSHNLFYAACSKNGCSKIKSILGEINTGEKFIEQSPHRKENTKLLAINDIDNDEALNVLFGDQVFRFAFVRNPFERAISCYLNRIKELGLERYDNQHSARKEHQENIDKINYWKNSPSRKVGHISFEDFIEYICQQDIYDMDRHWLPQHISIHSEIIEYDFIGKLESFEEDISYILNKAGIDSSAIDLKSKTNETPRQAERINYFFNTNLKEIFYKKYYFDFKLYSS